METQSSIMEKKRNKYLTKTKTKKIKTVGTSSIYIGILKDVFVYTFPFVEMKCLVYVWNHGACKRAPWWNIAGILIIIRIYNFVFIVAAAKRLNIPWGSNNLSTFSVKNINAHLFQTNLIMYRPPLNWNQIWRQSLLGILVYQRHNEVISSKFVPDGYSDCICD